MSTRTMLTALLIGLIGVPFTTSALAADVTKPARVAGQLTKIDGKSLTIATDGKDTVITCNDTTKITRERGSAKFDDLKVGQPVRAYYNPADNAALAVMIARTEQEKFRDEFSVLFDVCKISKEQEDQLLKSLATAQDELKKQQTTYEPKLANAKKAVTDAGQDAEKKTAAEKALRALQAQEPTLGQIKNVKVLEILTPEQKTKLAGAMIYEAADQRYVRLQLTDTQKTTLKAACDELAKSPEAHKILMGNGPPTLDDHQKKALEAKLDPTLNDAQKKDLANLLKYEEYRKTHDAVGAATPQKPAPTRVAGQLSKIDGKSLTITADGKNTVIKCTDTTKIARDGGQATFDDLKVGQSVRAYYTPADNAALAVIIAKPPTP